MAAPRRDTRGIVDAGELFARVRFRRREPAPALRPYLEHYWLIDWDLPEPYASHVVPHPSVNVVFQRHGDGRPPFGEVAGIGLGLFTQKLEGRGRVCGVQFRPGGFRPFAPGRPVADWTGRRLTLEEVFGPPADRTGADTDAGAGTGAGVGTGTGARAGDAVAAVLGPEDEDDEDARVAALDAYLLALGPRPDPQADLAMALVDRIRTDRAIRRVGDFARAEGLSVRVLQRLFAAYVGVGPKWIILRYRIHEALEHAETSRTVDWAALAADLGYADQAHLVRDFTATVGVPPTAYAQARSRRGNRPDRADRPGPADPPDRPLRDRADPAGTGRSALEDVRVARVQGEDALPVVARVPVQGGARAPHRVALHRHLGGLAPQAHRHVDAPPRNAVRGERARTAQDGPPARAHAVVGQPLPVRERLRPAQPQGRAGQGVRSVVARHHPDPHPPVPHHHGTVVRDVGLRPGGAGPAGGRGRDGGGGRARAQHQGGRQDRRHPYARLPEPPAPHRPPHRAHSPLPSRSSVPSSAHGARRPLTRPCTRTRARTRTSLHVRIPHVAHTSGSARRPRTHRMYPTCRARQAPSIR